MLKKYTTPCPPMGCGVVGRHLEMVQPTKGFFVSSLHSQRCRDWFWNCNPCRQPWWWFCCRTWWLPSKMQGHVKLQLLHLQRLYLPLQLLLILYFYVYLIWVVIYLCTYIPLYLYTFVPIYKGTYIQRYLYTFVPLLLHLRRLYLPLQLLLIL